MRTDPTIPVLAAARGLMLRLRAVPARTLLALTLGGLASAFVGAVLPDGVSPFAIRAAAAQQAALVPAPRTLSITGSGQASTRPDMALITAGVITDAKTAAAAVKGNTDLMQKLIFSLKVAGIEERDIQTSDFSVNPRYDDRGNEPPKLAGYSVSNQLTLRIRDLDRFGRTLDQLVQAGANQINGIQFVVSKADELLDKARTSAVTNARRKAEIYAAAAGVTLGDVLSISEIGASGPMERGMRNSVQMRDASAVPIAAGEQTLDVQVAVVWVLK